MEVRLEKNASAHFIAHCLFPKAEEVKHVMDAVIKVGEGAEMKYSENHYHGLYGGHKGYPKGDCEGQHKVADTSQISV